MTIKQISAAIALVLTLSGAIWGGIEWHGRFAQAEEVAALAARVEKNELEQAYYRTLQEYYFLQDQLRKYPGNQEIMRRLDEVQRRLNRLESKLGR